VASARGAFFFLVNGGGVAMMRDMTRKSLKKILAMMVAVMTTVFALYQQAQEENMVDAVPEVVPSTESIPEDLALSTVTRVVDGDTLAVMIDGEEKKIRMIGINSPESVDPRKKVECFGKEASAHLEELVEGKSVQLIADPTQDDIDRYGRLLRYVELQDGTDINATMIRDGFAYEYTYDVAYERQSEYRGLQQIAEDAGRGLWSSSTCNGAK
jgi:micrococcal nuclease